MATSMQKTINNSLLRINDRDDSINYRLSIILIFLYILALTLLPVYIFPSGRPQLADGPILILIIIYLFKNININPLIKQNIINYIPFVIWATIINVAFFIYHSSNYLLLLKNSEIIYNLLVFWAFSYINYEFLAAKKINIIHIGLFLSFASIFIAKGYYDEGVRSTLSFNNPNQLGYYGLLFAAIATLLLSHELYFSKTSIIKIYINIITIIMGHLLVLMSLSRGALLGILILDIWVIIQLLRKLLIAIIPLVLILVLFLIWQPSIIQQKFEGRQDRELSTEKLQEEAESRIFYKLSIMKGINYLIGKGGALVAEGKKRVGEVHNIIGEIFRSYGIIGLLLFSYWLARMFWRSRIVPGGVWIWMGLLTYNMTHYGLRFRSFWILLAMLNAMTVLQSEQRHQDL